jgi:hypothetical protein
MSQPFDPQIIELSLKPIPPDTVESLRAELQDYIRAGLQESGNPDLLERKELVIKPDETIPVDVAVTVVVEVLTGGALIAFEQVVLPWLKRKYELRQRRKRKRKRKR